MAPLLLLLAVSAAAQSRAPELVYTPILLAQDTRAYLGQRPGPNFFDVLRETGVPERLADALPEKNITVFILPAGTSKYDNNAQTWPRAMPDGSCKLHVVHPSITRKAMTHQLSTLPEKYLAELSGPDYTFHRVLLHEAHHCGMAANEEGLAFEIEAEVFAARALLTLPGGRQEVRVQRNIRAVRALLGEGVSHALAPSIDAVERGLPLPDPVAVERAHFALYQLLYAEELLFEDVHGYSYEPEADLIRQVYAFMKRGLAAGRFDHDALMRREAELYVEAVRELAPALLDAYPELLALDRALTILNQGGAVGAQDRAFLAEWLPALLSQKALGWKPGKDEKAELERWFPGLALGEWRALSKGCRQYNCFSWSVGETGKPLHPIGVRADAVDEFYLQYGYLPLSPGEPPASADVAAWAIRGDFVHVARRATDELWESKLGQDWYSVRALHRLETLDSDSYGRPARFYRKASPAELQALGVVPLVPRSDGKDPCAAPGAF